MGMNYEPGAIGAAPSNETVFVESDVRDAPAAVDNRRRNIKRAGIGASLVLALAAGYFAFARPKGDATQTTSTTTTTTTETKGGGRAAPRVTVIVPGRTQVARVISTTGIKCAGNSVELQGIPYPQPYVITAVGDVDAIEASIDLDPSVNAYRRDSANPAIAVGWDLQQKSDVTVPAYTGLRGLEYAKPLS